MTEDDLEPATSQDGGVHERDELLRMFAEWDVEFDRHWMSWRRESRQNYDVIAGRAWTRDEYAEMEDLNRVPVEFNRTLPLVKAVAGAEIAGRLRVEYKPRTLGDSKTNEMLTSGAEWIRDECDAGGEESQAFFDCLVCGLGVTETRLDFEEDADGRVIEDCVDPLEMDIDPSARKTCAVDARKIRRRREFSKREAKERFGYEVETESNDEEFASEHQTNPERWYDDEESSGRAERATVTIKEYQWYELRSEYLVLHPQTGRTLSVPEAQFAALKDAAIEAGRAFQHTRRRYRVYRRAFVAGRQILEIEDLPTRSFTYKFITGDRDHNRNTWFGLVRPMRDPQKWANRFFSLILHIIATNAKGGVMIEEDAVEDIQEFEENWAASDAVSVLAPGKIEKVKEKPQAKYPAGLDRLMEHATTAIREVAGISPEFLGTADRDQPGVLEHQRKQAAYGIMGTYFDSLRRFRKGQGTLLLVLMSYLPRGTLVRVALDDWENPRYVPMEQLALDPQTMRYDVIVDEAPSGPNQKERTFAIILQILPLVKDALTPEIWLEILRFSPLPESFVEKIKAAFAEAEQSPEAVLQKQIAMEGGKLALADKAADVAGKQASAAKTDAETKQVQLEALFSLLSPDPQPQVVM
ncbi:MAG: hypothetical protein KDA53_12655 [Hyphomonas sp.]|nr:hypothetical protein [Hyphomonas sp.]